LSPERLRRISLGLRARTDKTTLSLGDLHAIRPGDVLGLEVRFEEPALLEVNGKVLFAGRLVTAGGRRAIRIEQKTAPPELPA
jgi:flagellar motor switch protein FliM